MTTSLINTYDIDGVIYLGPDFVGLTPRPDDIIITGRSYEEEPETKTMFYNRGIKNQVFFAPWPFLEKTRVKSGHHKGHVIHTLKLAGYQIGIHFEDDPIQAEIISTYHKNVVLINQTLVPLENVRHTVEKVESGQN